MSNKYTILTASGVSFDLANPKAELISIHDISLSLSRECRYNNHCNTFYSVADHVLNGRKYVDPKHLKYWDLHDAEECYLGDVPTPLKRLLGQAWEAVREGVHKAICERFNLPTTEPPEVKMNDTRLLLAEREVLFDKQQLMELWWIDTVDHNIEYDHVDVIIRPMWKSYKEYYDILKQYR